MHNKFLALTILAFVLFTGAAVAAEVLTLDPGATITDSCSGPNC